MGNHDKFHRGKKALAIIALIFTIAAILLAHSKPTTGYELSIYESTPVYVWGILALSTLIALSLIFFSVIFDSENSRFWIIGLLILLLNRISVQWMPYIRGYYTLSGDQMSNIGYVIDVLNFGHTGLDNFYPITHILLAEISTISNFPPILLSNCSTAMMSAFCVISIYLLARLIFMDRKICILAVSAAASVLFSGYDLYLMPNGWSIHYIPFVFLLFFKSRETRKIEWIFLLILCLLVIPFFHPLTSVFFIFAFLIVGITDSVVRKYWHERPHEISLRSSIPFVQILILSVAFITWITSFNLFRNNLRTLYLAITTGSGPSFLNELGVALSKLGMTGIDFMIFIIKSMGHNAIFLLIAVVAFVVFVRKKGYKEKENGKLMICFAVSGASILLYASYLTNLIPWLEAIGGSRLLAYAMIFTPIFSAWLFLRSISKKRFCSLKVVILVLIIFTASTMSVLSIHPSPYTKVPGAQISKGDIKAVSWAFSEKEKEIEVSSILSSMRRYSHLLFGEIHGGEILPHLLITPDHFGYGIHENVGSAIGESRYIVINQIDLVAYTTVWSSVGRFSQKDFARLYCDPSIHKLYTSGYSEIWFAVKP